MSDVYAYEVTTSSLPGTKVGGCLIDVELEPSRDRSWPLWNQTETRWEKAIQAIRRDQICKICFASTPQLVRVHGHDGRHGPAGLAPQYVPPWMEAGATS